MALRDAEAFADLFQRDGCSRFEPVRTIGSISRGSVPNAPYAIRPDFPCAARIAPRVQRVLHVHPPEDILLQKLRWFRLGGEVSDRQWRDVLAIIRVQGPRLDRD
jgi:hypothetical protein